MKIKEKGLPGKAAKAHKAFMWHSRGFNAFQGMTREKGRFSGPKKDVFLNFMGTKMLFDQDEQENGRVKEDDVPFIRGATLKFDGCGGEVRRSGINVRLVMLNSLSLYQAVRSKYYL
jgi:lupus La protein